MTNDRPHIRPCPHGETWSHCDQCDEEHGSQLAQYVPGGKVYPDWETEEDVLEGIGNYHDWVDAQADG